MTDFEIVVLTISLVLGLGIAQILSAFAAAVRSREERTLHWLPLIWAALIFLFHANYFFVLLDLDAAGLAWTWDYFGPRLLHVILLFLAGALVLPKQESTPTGSLLHDFDRHGRLGLIPLGLFLLVAIPMNVQAGGAWLSQANMINTVLVVLVTAAFVAKQSRSRTWVTILYAALQMFAMFFIWSSPGARMPIR